ncbi:Pro-kumamolisin [Hypoxylon crocopeplum]|nr:Pro-kumamolisin [Hypoxylon crocopeplum]
MAPYRTAILLLLSLLGTSESSSLRPPSQWERTSPASDNTIVRLQIGLKHNGFDELERRLGEISDPSHSQYGRHLSRTEIETLVKPSPDAIQATREWLYSNGVIDFEHVAGDWVTASVPIRQAEALLNCTYHKFVHTEDGDTLIRTLDWSLPDHLRDHIDVVQPTNSFLRPVAQDRYGGQPAPSWDVEGRLPTYEELVDEDIIDRGHLDIPTLEELPKNPTILDGCNRIAVSPLCLRVMYGTLGYETQSIDKNKIGVVNFLGNNNNRSDIARYLELYRPDAAKAGAADAFETVLIAGAEDQQTPNTPEQLNRNMGLEGAFDVETLLGVGYPTPLIAWNVGGKPPFQASQHRKENSNEPYMEWLNHVLAQDSLPPVISISYADEEQTVPEDYARRVCEGFAKLGARGVSVIVASGDDGVGVNGKCFSNDGSNKPKFLPTFPASCPFVTSVGATRHLDPVMVGFDARGGFMSGGGFSDYFDRPKYQDSAVKSYLKGLNTTYRGLYNPDGRGIPDVSAMGYHHTIVWNGIAHLLDGTSGSAPTFAAIIALINDALLAEGRPPLGFLNPWLYSSALTGLKDVSFGSNRGCDTLGFDSVEGWDAATGLGTPWFPKLKEIALASAFRYQRPWYMNY